MFDSKVTPLLVISPIKRSHAKASWFVRNAWLHTLGDIAYVNSLLLIELWFLACNLGSFLGVLILHSIF